MLEADTDLESLLDAGRLAGIYCRLNVERFTGLLCVEHADETTVFNLVEGRPVLAEGSTPGASVAEGFLKSGAVSRDQYAKIVSRMTESLVDSEDVVFCREAVALGAVTQEQVDEEMSRRVRSMVVQSIGWEDCYIEVEEDPDLADRGYPAGEPIGALVLTGVRTFYFDAELTRELGKLQFARLTLDPSTVAGFFELDASDRRVIEVLDGRRPYAEVARRLGVDAVAVRQLLCALNYAGCVELASQAFAHARADQSSGSVAAEQRQRSESEQAPARPAAAAPQRAPTPPKVTPPPSSPGRPDHVADQLKAYMDDTPAPSARGGMARGQIASHATQRQADRATSYRTRAESPAPTQAPTTTRKMTPAEAHSSAPPRRESVTNAAPRAREPVRPVRERANRKLGAIQRLGKELQKTRREPGQPRAQAPQETSNALKSLVLNRRRAAAQTQNITPQARAVDAQDAFRQGMDLLRDQQWARALNMLTQASEAEPDNAPYRMHMLWASFKSTAQPSVEVMQDLRNACRDQLQSDDNRGFAYYYMAHMALHGKKDDQAEKFFRKALARDKNNKDAERHLLILERRRGNAEKAKKGNKVFGIELTLTRQKPEDDD